jgi:hypothetical protein
MRNPSAWPQLPATQAAAPAPSTLGFHCTFKSSLQRTSKPWWDQPFKQHNNNQSLSNLCNAQHDIYGKRGDQVWLQILKTIYWWQVLKKKGKYVE